MDRKLKEEFIEDYKASLMKLYKQFFPILEEGWTEEELYNLMVFMEKNRSKVKGKTINEVVSLYNKRDTEKI